MSFSLLFIHGFGPALLLGWTCKISSIKERKCYDTSDRRKITRQESRWIIFTMEESATTSIMYDNRISKFYRRLASRRGKQKAK
jgi:hypothetical protein